MTDTYGRDRPDWTQDGLGLVLPDAADSVEVSLPLDFADLTPEAAL